VRFSLTLREQVRDFRVRGASSASVIVRDGAIVGFTTGIACFGHSRGAYLPSILY
jgi:hypothetical protein